MTDFAPPILVQNVTLRIPIVRRKSNTLKADPLSLLASFYKVGKTRRELHTIIQGLSFTVETGWRVALIGRNGAGKTTLLRLLAGSYRPSQGKIVVRGNAQAMLNLSLGFKLTATGLENIFLRGLSMGIPMAEVQKKAPEIVEFTELGDAIYDPMQTYSAGMRAKLAFAIATSREPDVLLMDEWISTGDKFFVAKARQRLHDQVNSCKALVLASHSRGILQDICTHGLVIENGSAAFFGPVDDALQFYDDMAPAQPSEQDVKLSA